MSKRENFAREIVYDLIDSIDSSDISHDVVVVKVDGFEYIVKRETLDLLCGELLGKYLDLSEKQSEEAWDTIYELARDSEFGRIREYLEELLQELEDNE